MIHYNPEFSGSVTGTEATISLSGSFTGSGHIDTANTASKLTFSASFGLGIENTFNFDGSSNQIINLDTASNHFISGAREALNNNTASFVLTASISGLTQSFTKGDGSTFINLLPDTGSVDLQFSMSNLLGIEAFSFDNTANAGVQIDTSSAHFTVGVSASQATTLTTLSASFSTSQTNLSSSASTAREAISSSAAASIQTNSASIASLSASSAIERLNYVTTSSIIGGGNIIQFTKGDNSTYLNTILTGSFAKSVNGNIPDPTTGNVAVAIGSVETGLSSSIPASADDADIWIVSGETGANTGSNGKAFIYSTASAQWFEISNLDQVENDVRYVNTFGDTMTGLLVLSGDPTLPLHASTRQYVDRAYISSSIDGTTISLFTGQTPATEHSHSITNAISASYSARAERVEETLNQGLGIETFSYDGDTAGVIVQLDTSSAHFTVGVSASQAATLTTLSASFSTSQTNLSSSAATALTNQSASNAVNFVSESIYRTQTGSFVTTASISGLTQSFTKGDGSTFQINLPDTGSVDLQFSMSNLLGIEPFTFDNTANAGIQVNTASFHVANLTASLLQTASNGLFTMSFTKGDASTFDIPLSASRHSISSSYAITASHVTNVYRESVTGAATYTITHNLDSQYNLVQSYDTATNVMVIPSEITASTANTLDIKFASAFTGIVVVKK